MSAGTDQPSTQPPRSAAFEIEDLTVYGPTGSNLVNRVSMSVATGECLGLVGESGSGKTLTIRAIADLLPPGLRRDYRRVATSGRIGMVFQDPMRALNPLMTVARTLREPVMQHQRLGRAAADRRGLELLREVGIEQAARVASRYPHQLSGGLRQRVLIAAALACQPDILLCDEPTTALDVTTQATILQLLNELRRDRGLSMVFVSHDLAVISRVSDRIAVMYSGQLVEAGSTSTILNRPRHAYTAGLLRSIPSRGRPGERMFAIRGTPPRATDTFAGCHFAPRCPFATDACTAAPIELRAHEREHIARCVHPDEVAASLSLPTEHGGWPTRERAHHGAA